MDERSSSPVRAEVDELLREGIRHAKAGGHARARELLARALDLDERCIAAWLWMSAVVEGAAEKATCLEHVLALDPEHSAARRGLAMLRARERSAAPAQAPVAAPVPPLWSEPPDPLLCPYCAALTEEKARRCASCGGELWLCSRRRETHSVWLLNLIAMRFVVGVVGAIAPIVVLALLAQRLTGDLDPFLLLRLYVGLPHSVAPRVARAALQMVPRAYLTASLALSAYSFALAGGMVARWKPVYWLVDSGTVVRFGLSIAGLVAGQRYGLICGGAGVLVSIAAALLVLAVEDDFGWDRQRVYMQLDRRSREGMARLERAGVYADLGMWALAVLYLRAAVAKMPTRVPVYVRLARGYMRLGRPDLARVALHDGARIDAQDPAVRDLP